MSFNMGFEIKMASGPISTPTQFIPWNKKTDSSDYTPTTTLKYMNDALIGMNYHVLNQFKHLSNTDTQFIKNYLKNIDPYFEIYAKSSLRLKDVYKKTEQPKPPQKLISDFENEFSQAVDKCFSNDNVQLKFIGEALNILSDFEKKLGNAFLYNFTFEFSENFTGQLISFYSFLFHIRTVTAMNHNDQVSDSAFESIRCDSISDYLARTDYTANDALLYWQFKKLTTPFVGVSDVRVEKLLVNPLEQAFFKFNHNACSLVNNLPESFLTTHNAVQLEDALHQIQVDWLLGSSCGLLFRLREEFYGLQHGYDKIFWPEASYSKPQKVATLNFCFELSESDFLNSKKTG